MHTVHTACLTDLVNGDGLGVPCDLYTSNSTCRQEGEGDDTEEASSKSEAEDVEGSVADGTLAEQQAPRSSTRVTRRHSPSSSLPLHLIVPLKRGLEKVKGIQTRAAVRSTLRGLKCRHKASQRRKPRKRRKSPKRLTRKSSRLVC